MKRFAFRLDSVLRVRRFELERARAQLAALESERLRREELARVEWARLVEGRKLLEAETREGADGERLGLRADAVSAGRYRFAQAERAVAELTEPLAEARRRVRHAHARARSLERLREEAEQTHRREGLAAEQAEIEELAIARVALERAGARNAFDAASSPCPSGTGTDSAAGVSGQGEAR